MPYKVEEFEKRFGWLPVIESLTRATSEKKFDELCEKWPNRKYRLIEIEEEILKWRYPDDD